MHYGTAATGSLVTVSHRNKLHIFFLVMKTLTGLSGVLITTAPPLFDLGPDKITGRVGSQGANVWKKDGELHESCKHSPPSHPSRKADLSKVNE